MQIIISLIIPHVYNNAVTNFHHYKSDNDYNNDHDNDHNATNN